MSTTSLSNIARLYYMYICDSQNTPTSFIGLYAAAHDMDIEWIVIKGISDYADGTKSETDSWKQFASLMAASLTAHILSDTIVFQDWHHYGSASECWTFRARVFTYFSNAICPLNSCIFHIQINEFYRFSTFLLLPYSHK